MVTYRLARYIRVPDFGDKSHGRRFERICIGNLNVNLVRRSSIRRIWRRGERSCEVPQVDAVVGSGKDARVVPVCLDVCQLLGDTTVRGAAHTCNGIIYRLFGASERRNKGSLYATGLGVAARGPVKGGLQWWMF